MIYCLVKSRKVILKVNIFHFSFLNWTLRIYKFSLEWAWCHGLMQRREKRWDVLGAKIGDVPIPEYLITEPWLSHKWQSNMNHRVWNMGCNSALLRALNGINRKNGYLRNDMAWNRKEPFSEQLKIVFCFFIPGQNLWHGAMPTHEPHGQLQHTFEISLTVLVAHEHVWVLMSAQILDSTI